MSISLENVFVQVGEQYKMKLLAGKNGCSTSIDWVHLVEDSTVIQFLWSNDLVITLGVSFQTEETLMDCVKRLIKRHCAGLIINTGKYILEVPQTVIDYCEENDFPLITMPWEINVGTVTKDITIRCIQAQNEDRQIAQYFISAFTDPDSIENHRQELMTYFDVDGDFSVVLIQVENAHKYSDLQLQRVSARIRYYFENINCKYLLFWYDTYLVLLANNIAIEDLYNLTQRMYNRASRKMPEYPLNIGLGSNMKDLHSVSKNYKRAKAALKASLEFKQPIVKFNELGINKILLTMDDQDILKEIYLESLSPLLEYDEKHHTDLTNTLECYLKNNGSIQQISKEMFTHRNTVNYRVSKIKELLNTNLDNAEELFKYNLAFYIKKLNDFSIQK